MRKALMYFGCGVLGTAVSAAAAVVIKLGITPGYAQITPVVYWSIAAVVAIINLAFTAFMYDTAQEENDRSVHTISAAYTIPGYIMMAIMWPFEIIILCFMFIAFFLGEFIHKLKGA